MLILSGEQIRQADQFTIENEPIASIDLMERASAKCVEIIKLKISKETPVLVFSGHGNNGGDGLAICRLLLAEGYYCEVILINPFGKLSPDCNTNYQHLSDIHSDKITLVKTMDDLERLNEKLQNESLIIDALLGTGLNKPLEGLYRDVAELINQFNNRVISIDIPSGLYSDKANSPTDTIIRSSLTLTFQYPKLSLLMACNKAYVPEFILLDIGLLKEAEKSIHTTNFYITTEDVCHLLTQRQKFSHKGTYGHALLFAGSSEYKGAAILSARACLKSGAGLLTIHSIDSILKAITIDLPEAIQSRDSNNEYISETPDISGFDAIAFGPGTGRNNETAEALKKVLHYNKGHLIIDADGLNILSDNKTWLAFLPPYTILTPHPKEFDRLTENHHNDFERLESAKKLALKNNIIVVLKGSHTVIVTPNQQCFFNSSGNAGLAKGGSGDVLTGILLGLLTRGYSPIYASIIGVFLHGYAADILRNNESMESMLGSEIISQIGPALLQLEQK